MLASPMDVLNRLCLPKWQNTLTLSMSPAGSRLPQRHRQMSLRLILQITPW